MADKTGIEWSDATWNPITGCTVYSPGCTNCYAMKLAGSDPKLKDHPSRAGLTVETKAGPVWTGEVRFNPQWLEQPTHWRKPRMIFVVAHGDAFHDEVPCEWLDAILSVAADCPQHIFQILTKRAAGARAYFRTLAHRPLEIAQSIATHRPDVEPIIRNAIVERLARWSARPLPNVWLGASVEDQTRADERLSELLAIPAALHFASYEPALGPIDWTAVAPGLASHEALGYVLDTLRGLIVTEDGRTATQATGRLDWIIAGGESGPNARPGHPGWYLQTRDQCEEAKVAFMFKQWGNWRHEPLPDGSAIPVPAPNDPDRRVVGWNGSGSLKSPVALMVHEKSKRKAGNLLDGAQYLAFPAQADDVLAARRG